MKTVLIIYSFLMIAGLSGCQTMKGFGRDIQNAARRWKKRPMSNAQG